jgi:hypothetical protein
MVGLSPTLQTEAARDRMPSPALQGGKEDGGARVQPAGGPVGQAVVTPCRLTRI